MEEQRAHNFGNSDASVRWQAVTADGEASRQLSSEQEARVRRMRALEIDCAPIPESPQRIVIDPDGNILLPPRFMKGFVTIRTRTPLNIVAVYTAKDQSSCEGAAATGLSIDVETIEAVAEIPIVD